MNKILKVYHARIVMMSVSGWKQRFIYAPLATALYLLAYEGINAKNILKALHVNKKLINSFILMCILIYSSYWFGSEKNRSRIHFMQATIKNTLGLLDESNRDKEYAELQLQNMFNSRTYKEYVIHKEAGIILPKKVSDEDLDLMFEAADEFKIPYYIFFRLIQQESGFRWNDNSGKILTSRAGAMGYTQLMPSTFSEYCKRLNVEQEMTPQTNLRIGAKLLSDLYEMYNPNGDKEDFSTWKKPLMAYNAGCGNVSSGKADTFVETKNYVAAILIKIP